MKNIDTEKEKISIPEEPSQVYEKPCIEAEETFETFVLTCANSVDNTTDSGCQTTPYEG